MPKDDSNQQFIRRVFVTIGIIAAFLLICALFYVAIDVILLVFGAVLIAIFLRGLADLLNKYTRLSEGWSVMVVTVVLITVVAAAITLLAPSVAEQGRHLREELPKSAQQAGNFISKYQIGRTILDQLPSAEDVIGKIDAGSVLTRVGGYFSSTVGAVGNFFVMVLIAIYLASEPHTYVAGLTRLFPLDRRRRVAEIFAGIGDTLSWWLIGKTGSMLFIGVMTWIALSIVGIPLALTLGLIAGLLSFIPNFGPIFSAVPAILIAFIESPVKALYVLAIYIGVQIIESNIVTPIIERRTVELPPALTVVFQLALGVMIGGVGLILATPILAVVMVVVERVYIHDVLGDKGEEEPEGRREEIEEEAAEIMEETQ